MILKNYSEEEVQMKLLSEALQEIEFVSQKNRVNYIFSVDHLDRFHFERD